MSLVVAVVHCRCRVAVTAVIVSVVSRLFVILSRFLG